MTPPEKSLGQVTWHSSDEESGPDIGISIDLGDGVILYVGEISRDLHASDPEAVALGEDFGWWLTLYGPNPHAGGEPIAKFVSAHAAREFVDLLVKMAPKAQP